ncbi:hypothetical protein [Streptomyces lunaelactis]|uniref:hypothetical protein n=1 Tax=Streptomyces lunaelactis TaxID=1535768 RepID=UPI00131EE0C1|nr:hypothetical protein [Streptomyces lunaelactis]NUK84069.1 hypothetical protein [Streptomyces lunaelactis]NUL06005.1 hypothetical protein [Streptomyces lunaelactis]
MNELLARSTRATRSIGLVRTLDDGCNEADLLPHLGETHPTAERPAAAVGRGREP